jgi:hypothetical protein
MPLFTILYIYQLTLGGFKPLQGYSKCKGIC